MMRPVRILILGGSSEASALALALSGDRRYDATLSLAGRTKRPNESPIPLRIGGFGGVDGLARLLVEEGIDILIDATHPYAVQMKRNAIEAAKRVGLPLLAIRRKAWEAAEGDCWIEAADMEQAARSLGEKPKRVFLTVGRKELAPFARAPQHLYFIRSVDAPPAEVLPAQAEVITARGPFVFEAELALMRSHEIELLVTKNSGGEAAAPKLRAAREMQIPVVMVRRPDLPPAPESVESAEEALTWLERHHELTSSA